MKSTIERLGYSKNDRVIIINADDVGVSLGSIDAYLDLMACGNISTGSGMTPCSWFPDIARHIRENSHLDLGLHLPITCEYDAYRWRPLTNPNPKSGLVDEYGYFHKNPKNTGQYATVESVIAEVEAQIQLSLKMGVQPTHLDNHHGVLMFNSRFLDPFLELAKKYEILPILFDMNAQDLKKAMTRNKPPQKKNEKNPYGSIDVLGMIKSLSKLSKKAKSLRKEGYPIPDHISGMPTYMVEDRLTLAKKMFSELRPGLTHFAFHPVKDSPEVRAMTPTWPYRVADYETFMKPEIKEFLNDEGIHLIGYKPLAELMKN